MIVALAAMVWLVGPAQPQTAPLSPTAFRNRMEAAVSTTTHQRVIAVDERTFQTKQGDGTEQTISIDNVYAEYLNDPAQIDDIIARYVRLLVAPVPVPPIDQLIVIVRPTDYLLHSLAADASRANFMPPRPMGGDLSYYLAIDAADTIRLAGPADLARWHIDETAAWRRAVANIKLRIGPLVMTRLGSDVGAVGLGAASGLAPSLLADPATCGPAAPDGIDHQVVLVYSRDMILNALPNDIGMTRIFWKTAVEEIAAGRSMSSTVLTCRVGVWTVVRAPAL